MHKLGDPKPKIFNIQMDEMVFDVYIDSKGDGAVTSNLKKELPISADFLHKQKSRGVHCSSCNWTGREASIGRDLMRMSRLWERLEPGEEVPAGECPKCAGCVYLDSMRDFREEEDKVRSWNSFVEALEALVLAHALAGINIEHPKYIEGLHNAYLSHGRPPKPPT